jgi:transcriptional regulator with XRE-family HTH domain
MAEAVGISRVWYSRLESGGTDRTSSRVLDRIAAVLMLDQTERAHLFQSLARFGQIDLRPDSKQVLEAFSVVRSATKRLWAATTEVEALEKIGEEICGIVDDARSSRWSAG